MRDASVQEPKILLPKIDVIFKMLFGDKRNIEILVDFLKSILNIPENEYESIENTNIKKEIDKLGRIDVKITTKSGKVIRIELQVIELPEMPERIICYNSKMLVSQLKTGDIYDTLQKIISIVITDFEMIKDSSSYHHVFQLYDKSTGIKFSELVELHSLELNKIPKNTDNTKKYDWLQFLKAESEEEFLMAAGKNPMIQKAFVELKRLSQDENNRMLAETREKAIRDECARNKFAYNKGIQEGLQKGIEKGIQEGMEKGIQKGIQEGIQKGIEEGVKRGVRAGINEGATKKQVEIAKNLLTTDLSLEQIIQATGLSLKELQFLQN